MSPPYEKLPPAKFPQTPTPEPLNAFGLVGLILSFMGLMSCGLISPLGLLFSTIGLAKRPRGMAIGGVVLGITGCGGFMLLLLLFGLSILNRDSSARRQAQRIETEAMLHNTGDQIRAAHAELEQAQERFRDTTEIDRVLSKFEKVLREDVPPLPELPPQPGADTPALPELRTVEESLRELEGKLLESAESFRPNQP